MKDMKIGEYVRTKSGEIYKYISNDGKFKSYEQNGETYQLIGDIIKHSNNILDIIECGDYVDGYPVEKVEEEGVYTEGYGGIELKDIEEILTKEKYLANRYSLIEPEEDDEYEIIEDESIIRKLIK